MSALASLLVFPKHELDGIKTGVSQYEMAGYLLQLSGLVTRSSTFGYAAPGRFSSLSKETQAAPHLLQYKGRGATCAMSTRPANDRVLVSSESGQTGNTVVLCEKMTFGLRTRLG